MGSHHEHSLLRMRPPLWQPGPNTSYRLLAHTHSLHMPQQQPQVIQQEDPTVRFSLLAQEGPPTCAVAQREVPEAFHLQPSFQPGGDPRYLEPKLAALVGTVPGHGLQAVPAGPARGAGAEAGERTAHPDLGRKEKRVV